MDSTHQRACKRDPQAARPAAVVAQGKGCRPAAGEEVARAHRSATTCRGCDWRIPGMHCGRRLLKCLRQVQVDILPGGGKEGKTVLSLTDLRDVLAKTRLAGEELDCQDASGRPCPDREAPAGVPRLGSGATRCGWAKTW